MIWLLLWKRYTCIHKCIFSCIDVNLEVIFINPTLPLAEMNKNIFAEIDLLQLCGRKDVF